MEKVKENYHIKLSELCFYIFFVLLLFAKGIGLYDGQAAFKFFLIIAAAGWTGKMLLTNYTALEFVSCMLFILLGCTIYFVSHEKGALIIIMLLCGMKNMDLKKVFKAGAITWTLSFGALFLLTSLHIADSAFKVHDRLGMGRVIRWSLGYAHPNVLHISYLVLVCFLVYVLQNRIRIWHILLLGAGNLYVFIYSLSTTGFLVTTICLALVFYWYIRKRFCKLEQFLIQLCLPVCLFVSFGAPLLLKGKAFAFMDNLLNTRLTLSRWFLENQTIKIFGMDTTSIVTALRTMDNSYVYALITYGFLFLLVMILCYFQIIYKKTKQQDGIALCVILSCLIAGITEPFLFNTSFKNVSLLFIGAALFQKNDRGKKLFDLKLDRNIEIFLPKIKGLSGFLKENLRRHAVRLAAVSFIGMLLAGIFIFIKCPMPQRYLLPRKNFEYTDDLKEGYYLTSEKDILAEGDQILGFESEKTEMVAFSGNIAKLERFRNAVTGSLVSGLFVFAAGNIWLFWKKK